MLLGFSVGTVVAKDAKKDSPNPVFINKGLKYITIGCDSVNTQKNFDTNGERSKTIATLPIPDDEKLNGYNSFFNDVNFEAPITNGVHNLFTFHLDTNIKENVEMDVLIECYIK